MDIRTASVVVCVAVFFLTVVLIVQYQQNRQYRGLGLAATAQAVMLAAFASSMLPVPIWFQVIVVPATVVSLLILYAGLQQFLGEPVSSRWLLAYTGVSVVVIGYFSLIAPDLRWRRFCTYLLVAGCLVGLFWMLGRHRQSRVPQSVVFLRVVFAISAAFFAGLSLANLVHGDTTQRLFDATPTVTLAFLGGVVTIIMWTFGVVLMVGERLRSDLAEDRENVRQVFRASPDATAISRMGDGVILDVNEGFTQILGHSREAALGHSAIELGLWTDVDARAQMIARLEADGAVQDMPARFRAGNGRLLDVEISARVLRLQGVPHLITVTRDVTERVRLESELRRQALTDELTGLANRRAFLAALEDRVGTCCLAVIDLDGFKQINDTLGHAAGDALLKGFARLSSTMVPEGGMVGRLGGDEFGVMLPWVDTRLAARWVQALLDASTNCPFSAGLAMHGDTVDELMAEADRALYRAKHGGRNQVVPG